MEKISVNREKDFADRLWEKGTQILSCVLYFVFGFILSDARIFSLKAPLSVSLAAVCSGFELVFALLGGIAGGFLRLSGGELINSTVPLIGISGIVFALKKLDIRRKKQTVLSVSVFLLCAMCQTAVMFSQEASFSRFLLIVCSSLFSAACVTFYSGTVGCIKKRRSLYMLDNHSLVCVVASFCTLLLGSSQVSILGFRPARFFASFAILLACYLFSRSGGSIAGIAIGGCIAVSGTSVALSICYGICGLLAGIFSKFGQIVCALVFSVTVGIAALLDGTAEGISVFAEAASASLLFSLIPSSKLSRLRTEILNPKAKRVESEFSNAGNRLLDLSLAIGSVSECISSVSKGIEALSPADDIMVCMRVRERVCADCPLKSGLCPEEGEFSEILKKLSLGENVSAQDFSINFNAKCPSVPRLADSFNRVYANRNAVNALQANSSRNRELACGQFENTANLLRELSQQLCTGAQTFFNKEKSAVRVLSEQGFDVVCVSCVCPVSGAVRLQCIVKDIPPSTSLSRLTAVLSTELEAQFSPPKIRETKNGKELLFLRKELFKIRLGSACASCGNQKLCGDYFECFQTDSKAYIVLSDGMGTGGRAAIDSAMTVEIFSRLVRAGLSTDSALCITNSALSVKSQDESLSTLDVAEIDLFDGSVVVLKAGAAPSFYTSGSKIRQIELPSTPLGIMPKVKFSRYSFRLHGGDTLVMVSDGILGCGGKWVTDEMRMISGNFDACEFSENLLGCARRRCGEKFDDMTVITAVVEEI